MRKREVIIIGGMGPQASHAFHGRLLAGSRRLHDGDPDSFPEITHLSLQIPEFFGSSDNENKAVDIINQRLGQLKMPVSALVCMPCNTAHKLVNRLRFGDSQFVSMTDAVQRALTQMPVQKIGLLASPNTLSSGFYAKILGDVGKIAVLPSRGEANELDEIISAVIRGDDITNAKDSLDKLALSLEKRGAEAILLGCTELSVTGVSSELPVLDSLDVLTESVLEQMR